MMQNRTYKITELCTKFQGLKVKSRLRFYFIRIAHGIKLDCLIEASQWLANSFNTINQFLILKFYKNETILNGLYSIYPCFTECFSGWKVCGNWHSHAYPLCSILSGIYTFLFTNHINDVRILYNLLNRLY